MQRLRKLEKELVAHPNDRNILEALASFHQEHDRIESAKKYADRLRALDDNVTSVK